MRRGWPALVLVAVLALGGCGESSQNAPTPKASSSQKSVVVKVPDTALTMTIPGDWEQQSKGEGLVLLAPKASGDPAYIPNVTVSSANAGSKTLQQAGDAMTSFATKTKGWTLKSKTEKGPPVGNAPTYRITGTYHANGVNVAQVEEVIQLGGKKPKFVYVTASNAVGDKTGEKSTTAVLNSLAIPAGK